MYVCDLNKVLDDQRALARVFLVEHGIGHPVSDLFCGVSPNDLRSSSCPRRDVVVMPEREAVVTLSERSYCTR